MTSRSSNGMNDDDITRVFDAHDVDVPKALDDKILKAARQSGASSSSTAGTHAYRRNNWFVHGFAIAATVMLTIAIAPMLLQSPDTNHVSTAADADVTSVASSAVDVAPSTDAKSIITAASNTETEEAALADVTTELASVVEADERSEAAFADRLAEDSADDRADVVAEARSAAKASVELEALAVRKSSTQARESVTQQSISGGSASADTAELLDVDRVRAPSIGTVVVTDKRVQYDPDKPDTWLEAIKTLASENKTERAREEFDKFRVRYPGYQVDFRLDEFLQSLKTQEQATD